MLDVFAQFATNENSEINGSEVSFGGAQLLLARAGNAKYGKLLSQLVEKHQAELDLKNDAADALSDKIMIEVIATTILLGWSDVSYKGKKLDYSVANAKMLLGHKDFRREVIRLSDNIGNFRAKLEEAQAKN